MTPNFAFGFNNAFESAVSLTNHLHRLLTQTPEPTLMSVTEALEAYQTQRFARAKFCHDLTGFYTGFAAWDNAIMKWATILMPRISPDTFAVNQLAKWVKGGLKLEFLEVPEGNKGTVAFEDELGQRANGGNIMVWVGTSLAIAGLCAWKIWMA
jgi:hypothetical protein